MESPGEATTRGGATSEGSRGRRENVTLNVAIFFRFLFKPTERLVSWKSLI